MNVLPASVYGPKSIIDGFSNTAEVSIQSSFLVQGRDFYSNNVVQLAPVDVKVEIRDKLTNSEVISTGTMIDTADLGVFEVKYTPIKSGIYLLNVMIESLHVQGSPLEITVSTEPTSSSGITTLLLDKEC